MLKHFHLSSLLLMFALSLAACGSEVPSVDQAAATSTDILIGSDVSSVDQSASTTCSEPTINFETSARSDVSSVDPSTSRSLCGAPLIYYDTSAFAGLWDATVSTNNSSDVRYWYIYSDGDLVIYDYQQDGGINTIGENCYDIRMYTIHPQGGDSYRIDGLDVSFTRNGESLIIVLSDEDYLDLDFDGDTTETSTITLKALSSPAREDLNECEYIGEPMVYREPMTRAECASEGGSVVKDVGDGELDRIEYRCESGLPIAAHILNNREDGGEIVGGQFCCL